MDVGTHPYTVFELQKQSHAETYHMPATGLMTMHAHMRSSPVLQCMAGNCCPPIARCTIMCT